MQIRRMDPYERIARYYDLEHAAFEEDVQFYRSLVREGPVLEVGSGTGRITLALCDQGLEVWAVDPSPAMMERARGRLVGRENVHHVCTPVEEIDLPVRFATALMPLNVLWHLPDSAGQLAALRAVRRHLSPGGLLVVDVSNPLALADRGAAGEVRVRFRTPLGDATVTGFSAAWDDEAAQRLTLRLWYDESGTGGAVTRTHAELTLRYLFRAELELLLQLAGFRPAHVYGSYDLDDYSAAVPCLLVTALAE